jgi:protein phosphatase
VCIDNGNAQWFDLGSAILSATSQDMQNDVIEIGRLLLYLCTGQDELSPDLTLHPRLYDLVSQTLDGGYDSAQDWNKALNHMADAIRRPKTIDLRHGRRTDVGQRRSLNEDSLLVLDIGRSNRSISTPLGVYAVADGMGGHTGGEIASGIAIDVLLSRIASELVLPFGIEHAIDDRDLEQWLRQTTMLANQAVHAERRRLGNNMGSTLVWCVMTGDRIYVANVGDSRAYLISEQMIRQITIDHSLAAQMLAAEQITPDQARTHPQRNALLYFLGNAQQVQVDVFEESLSADMQALLCSDGLTNMVSDEDIHRIVREASSPQQACDRLVTAANQAGGTDNITVIVAQVQTI